MQKVGLEEFPRYLQYMHAQYDVISFYEKLGWIPLGNPFEEAQIQHRIMILPPQDTSKIKNLKCMYDKNTRQAVYDYLVACNDNKEKRFHKQP